MIYQEQVNSLEEWNKWLEKVDDYQEEFFKPNNLKEPVSFPCVVVWFTDHHYMCSYVEYVYPFGMI